MKLLTKSLAILIISLPLARVLHAQSFTSLSYTIQNNDISMATLCQEPNDYDWGDYDSDGDLDLLVAGHFNNGGAQLNYATKIFRNDGGSVFYDLRAPLTYLSDGQLRWGDFDNDGDLDVVFAGSNSFVSNGDAGFYKNNGGDSFSYFSPSTMPHVNIAKMAVADFNRDGRLDVVYSGIEDVTHLVKVYLMQNKGNWQFEQVVNPFHEIESTTFTWVDYNNDQLPDLFQAGNGITKLFINLGSEFQLVGHSFPVTHQPAVSWGDIDQDGFKDVLLSSDITGTFLIRNNGNDTFTNLTHPFDFTFGGITTLGDFDGDGDLDALGNHLNGSAQPQVEIFLNDGTGNFTSFIPSIVNAGGFVRAAWFDFDGDNKLDLSLRTGAATFDIWLGQGSANTLPSTPTNLSYSLTNTILTLNWTGSGDTESPGTVLEYDVRVGTASGKQDLLSSGSNSNGTRRVIWETGNAGKNNSITLLNFVTEGNIYWSVQAIDQSKGRSSFAGEQTFNVPANLPPVLEGQKPINIDPAVTTSHTITLNDFYVKDPDSSYPTDFTFTVQQGACPNFSLVGTTVTETNPGIIPCQLYIKVNDGRHDSNQLTAYISTTSAIHPLIISQNIVKTAVNTSFELTQAYLNYTPAAVVSLIVLPGPNYSKSGNTVTPTNGFLGTLKIPVMLSTLSGYSNIYEVQAQVINPGSNTAPTITGQQTIQIPQDHNTLITTASFFVNDPDNTYPLGYTLTLQPGANYTFTGTTIEPAPGYLGPLTVPVTVNDGITESAIFNASIMVVSDNHDPVPTSMPFLISATQDQPFAFQFPPYLFVDPDNDVLSYTLSEGQNSDISWLSFDGATRTLSGTPGVTEYGIGFFQIIITADDNNGGSAFFDVVFLFINNANTAPHFLTPVPNQSTTAGIPYTYTIDPDVIYDDESTNLYYNLRLQGGASLPAWLHFDHWTRDLSGTPSNADAGIVTLELIGIDQGGLAESTTFQMEVIGNGMKNIAGISPVPDVNVTFDTNFGLISFPSTAHVIYDDATTDDLAVTFLPGSYEQDIPGSYGLTGVLSLAPNTTNTFNLYPLVNVIVPKHPQTISFGGLTTKTYGDPPFTISATASSNLTVTYFSSNPAVATIAGNTVTLVGAGTTTITASQAGDIDYDVAPPQDRILQVDKASQTITFHVLPEKNAGDLPLVLSATSSSGLAVTYASSNPVVASISGNTLIFNSKGTADITASQAGNANYFSAPDVVRVLTVNQLISGDPNSGPFEVKVYPNPVQQELYASWPSTNGTESVLLIVQLDGKEVGRTTTHQNEATIPVGHYAAGQYIILIRIAQSEYRGRFVKK